MTTTSDKAEATGPTTSALPAAGAVDGDGRPTDDGRAPAEQHIVNQHVLSRVVVKQFEGPTPHGFKIGLYKVGVGSQRPIGRSNAGLSRDLLRTGSASAERLWARTENKINPAVRDVRAHGSRASSLSIAVLRRAMELHFARSKTTVALLDETWTHRSGAHIEALVDKYTATLTAQYRSEFDRIPTRGDLIELVTAYTCDGEYVNEDGGWTRSRVEHIFEMLGRQERTRRRVLLLRPSSSQARFLIGDAPVTTHLHALGEIATASRIGFDLADEVMMPFAPDLAVCLVRDEIERDTAATAVTQVLIDPDRVATLNRRQVRSAVEYVFHQPDHDFNSFIGDADPSTMHRSR